jgi:hypothetical protein
MPCMGIELWANRPHQATFAAWRLNDTQRH